jgi:esterase/lipase superfamily enzyme
MAGLAAIALLALASPGPAVAEPVDLADLVSANRALQYGLIAAGALNAPADPGNALRDDPANPTPLGAVKKEQIKKAIGLFASVYGARDVSTPEGLQAAMENIRGFDEKLRTALEIQAVTPIEGQQILVPRLLVAEKVDTEPLEKMFESPTSSIMIYTFKWPLRGNPPLEFLRTSLSKVANARIRSIRHSNHDFNVTISDRILKSGATRHHQRMAFAADGTIRGLYVRYPDSPTKEFVQPELLAPLRAYWTPPEQVLAGTDKAARLAALEKWLEGREIGEEQRDQLKDLVKDDEDVRDPKALQTFLDRWIWRHTMRAVSWIIHDEFEAASRWRYADVGDCFVEPGGGPPGTESVRIVYATNRSALDAAGKPDAAPGGWYGVSAETENALNIGCASIAVPKDLGAGMPLTIEPRRAAAPGGAVTLAPGFALLKSSNPVRVPAQRSDNELQLADRESWRYKREDLALVLVHGYHTSFEEALLRAARIAAATKYKGRVFLFSWPSASSVVKYMIDMDGAERSELHLTGFLRAILRNPEVKRVDVVAHSMGSQLLLRSLGDLRDVFYVRDDVRLGQVIFAAPDVSKDVFDEKIRETAALADAITIYAADNDKPLKLSSYLRGGNERLGLIGDLGSHRTPHTNVVDASTRPNICNGWNLTHLEHSYFVDNPVTLRHIATVLSRTGRGVRPGEKNPFDDTWVTRLSEGRYQLKQDVADCWWKPW